MDKIQEMIKKHLKIGEVTPEGFDTNFAYREAMTEYAEHVTASLQSRNSELEKRIAELEAENKWIPVSERLPELGEKVLVYFGKIDNTIIGRRLNSENGEIWVVFFSDGELPCVGKYSETITHWQPLPQPPKSLTTSLAGD